MPPVLKTDPEQLHVTGAPGPMARCCHLSFRTLQHGPPTSSAVQVNLSESGADRHRCLRSLRRLTPCQFYHDPGRRLRLHAATRERIFRELFEQYQKPSHKCPQRRWGAENEGVGTERTERRWSCRSLGRPQCCSSVAEHCGYSPSSRLAVGPNLWPRHLRSFVR